MFGRQTDGLTLKAPVGAKKMYLVTIEGFMIPLNVRNHTLHVHRAMKTEMKLNIMFIFKHDTPYFAVSPSFSVRFFMTLLIFGKPQVFPAEKKHFIISFISPLSNNETVVCYTIMENKTFWFN